MRVGISGFSYVLVENTEKRCVEVLENLFDFLEEFDDVTIVLDPLKMGV